MDIVIRGGTIVDGSGAAPYRADLRIADGRIVEIGDLRVDARAGAGAGAQAGAGASREIDAGGLYVTPGFVDIHTHYDPQVLWDPALTPSCWHGVTSVVAGNCGYSIAPTAPEGRATLLRTLDKVEDMRLATLEAGVCWDFETYPEYLDTVARLGTIVNFGGYVGHTAVRIYVMGDDAYERDATDDEIARMRAIVADSVRGGALGFSSDRAGFHLGDGGRPVPSIRASQAETEALMGVLGEIGQGVVHVAPGENYRWLYDFQPRLRRRLNWSSILTYPAAVSRADYRDKLADHLAGRAAGADVWVQVTCRPITQLIAMGEPTAFYAMGAFKELVARDQVGRRALYADRAWRDRVEADLASSGLLAARWGSTTVVDSPSRPDLVGRSVAAIASDQRCSPWDAMCDLAIADALATRFEITFANDDVDGVSNLLRSEGAIMGLSDAGAHVGQICDAVMPTDFLSRWVRDRGLMPMERGIRKLTGEIADVVELDGGRGYLRVGAPADVLVLDWDALSPGPVRRVHDMPAGGDRLIADVPTGIEHVMVNGIPIRRDGSALDEAETGRPGTVLRSRAPR